MDALMPIPDEIAARLKRERKRAGMTQKQLAKAAEVHWSTVSKIEQQQVGVSVQMLANLAKAMGCGLHDLVPDDPG